MRGFDGNGFAKAPDEGSFQLVALSACGEGTFSQYVRLHKSKNIRAEFTRVAHSLRLEFSKQQYPASRFTEVASFERLLKPQGLR